MANTISDLILATLCSARSTKTFNEILREREFMRRNEASVRVALSRLTKNKYAKHDNQGWRITRKGLRRAVNPLGFIPSPFEHKSPTLKTIVSFDVPESKRICRNWLRNQLKIFDYKMLQQSLWLGPGPLPQEFYSRLVKLSIRENVKIFSISKKN